jgi:hypothetical protein
MPFWLKISLILLCIVMVLFALDHLLLWMESRNWIYWRRRPPGSSPLAGVMKDFQHLVEPQSRQVIEDQRQRQAVRDDQIGQK